MMLNTTTMTRIAKSICVCSLFVFSVTPAHCSTKDLRFYSLRRHDEPVTSIAYPDGRISTFKYSGDAISEAHLANGLSVKRGIDGTLTGSDGTKYDYIAVTPKEFVILRKFAETQFGLTRKDGSTQIVSEDQMAGLDLYPDTDVRRDALNHKLDEINKQLPNSSFSSVMLKDIQQLGLPNVDIWYGSQVRMDGADGYPGDDGALYDRWNKLPGIEARQSSHKSKPGTNQYQIKTGYKDSALLFGVDPSGNTFFQLEHDYAGGNTGPQHERDYKLYRLLNENIGPVGVSPYVDEHPLVMANQQPRENTKPNN